MIRVDRSRVAAPALLTDATGRGRAEAKRADDSLNAWKGAPAKWTFKFSVYSDPEVKLALSKLFHGKCAYCETYYGATQPMDVEHWRPKGQVDTPEGPFKPAYYWLAATWENLLPSCIDCNRKRKQRDALTGAEVLAGKEDQFPLADGSPRAKAEGEESGEIPLLLNPCADDPSSFLMFTPDGVVKPRKKEGIEQERARASIQVYALNRSGLVLSRKEHLRTIQLRIARIRSVTRLLDQPLGAEVVVVLEELLLNDFRELARMKRADQPHAQQARQLIDRWLADLTSPVVVDSAFETSSVPGRAQ